MVVESSKSEDAPLVFFKYMALAMFGDGGVDRCYLSDPLLRQLSTEYQRVADSKKRLRGMLALQALYHACFLLWSSIPILEGNATYERGVNKISQEFPLSINTTAHLNPSTNRFDEAVSRCQATKCNELIYSARREASSTCCDVVPVVWLPGYHRWKEW